MKMHLKNILDRSKRFAHHPLLIVAVMFVLHSCTERIDIQTDEEFQKLAVEGYISPERQFVRLTQTSGYFSQQAPAAVRDANVVVTSSDGDFQFSEDAENPGYYMPPENFIIEEQSTYQLRIELAEEIGGESTYESEATMPVRADQIDSVNVFFREDFETWIVQLFAFEPPGPNFYMFNAWVNGEAITDSLSRVGVVDDRIVDGTYLNGIWILFLNEDEVALNDTVVVTTSSITEDYYRYLTEAQTELRPKNPLFSGPPANVRSNISNGAIGYFAVYSSAFSMTIVSESDL
jgi:hypothetical protein